MYERYKDCVGFVDIFIKEAYHHQTHYHYITTIFFPMAEVIVHDADVILYNPTHTKPMRSF